MAELNEPNPFSAENLETWSSLATILEWLPAALDAQLEADSGITHFEYGILFALANAPELTLRMSVLAGYANSSLSRLSRATKRLEARDLLSRRPDPKDGRYTLATLSPGGLDQFRQATPGHVRTVHRLVLDPLTKKQKIQLRDISRRIQGAIRGESGWQPTS
jgi:DNA-binding MarR family transcriptional regulator